MVSCHVTFFLQHVKIDRSFFLIILEKHTAVIHIGYYSKFLKI